MGGDGIGQGVEVVAAFEEADEAAGAVVVGGVEDGAGHPMVGFGFEVERGEGVESVGVEAGTDEDEFRVE